MPKEKYKNNIAYLFKKKEDYQEGYPFYCNEDTKTKRIFQPQSNTYKSVAVDVLRTTTQLDYEQFDKVSFLKEPTVDDFAVIQEIKLIPYQDKGNKHRKVKYFDYTLEIS